jgi:hypothetical protein
MTCPTQNSGASTSRAMCSGFDKPWTDGCKIVVRCERNVASAPRVSTLAFKGDLMMKRLVMGALVSISMVGAGGTLAQVALPGFDYSKSAK